MRSIFVVFGLLIGCSSCAPKFAGQEEPVRKPIHAVYIDDTLHLPFILMDTSCDKINLANSQCTCTDLNDSFSTQLDYVRYKDHGLSLAFSGPWRAMELGSIFCASEIYKFDTASKSRNCLRFYLKDSHFIIKKGIYQGGFYAEKDSAQITIFKKELKKICDPAEMEEIWKLFIRDYMARLIKCHVSPNPVADEFTFSIDSARIHIPSAEENTVLITFYDQEGVVLHAARMAFGESKVFRFTAGITGPKTILYRATYSEATATGSFLRQ